MINCLILINFDKLEKICNIVSSLSDFCLSFYKSVYDRKRIGGSISLLQLAPFARVMMVERKSINLQNAESLLMISFVCLQELIELTHHLRCSKPLRWSITR